MAYYQDSATSSDFGEEMEPDDSLLGEAPEGYNPDVLDDTSSTCPERCGEPEDGSTIMAARAYQREMLEASLKQNTIVAMDTGSGKTQAAVLRILAELEKAPLKSRVWFLAPTVSLCSQQLDVLRTQIPAVHAKFLSSSDNIDSWSDQKIWDAVLRNVRIVVSTYQVLFDALSHAFVKFQHLALIVFDEAHNCTKKHAGRRIMTEFYHPAKEKNLPVPKILGLTASPVMRSNLTGLEKLERTLDAVCRTPTMHREELLTHVKRPAMLRRSYVPTPPLSASEGFTRSMLCLHDAFQRMDIHEDPYVHRLQLQNTERSRRKLEVVLEKHDTPIHSQVKSFCRKTVETCGELGPWAADYYIYEVMRRLSDQFVAQNALGNEWAGEEKTYLLRILQPVAAQPPPKPAPDFGNLSGKLTTLLQILANYEGDPAGIIFVKERSTAAVLSHVLSIFPGIGGRYRPASVVGTSIYRGKQSPLDLSRKEDLQALGRFRSSRVNLLVATSVLEEGIDVPACNLVVCFDQPTNLKSFIQRRGRARKHSSQLYLLFDHSSAGSVAEWEKLEADMKNRYEDEMRELQEVEELEASEVPDFPPLFVEKTGARLTINDAKAHLDHFCATVTSRKFVDSQPDFIVEAIPGTTPGTNLLRATVLLPSSLPEGLRRTQGAMAWKAERNACSDAAFQAYKALYEAGLVNDNLLPIKEGELSREVEGRAGITTVQEQFNPWYDVAGAWASAPSIPFRRHLRLFDEHEALICGLDILLPVPIPDIGSTTMYWAHDSTAPWTFEIDVDTSMADTNAAVATLDTGKSIQDTATLISMCYGHRWPIPNRHQIVRFECPTENLTLQRVGSRPFTHELSEAHSYLVRDVALCPYIYNGYLPRKPPVELVNDPYRGMEDAPEDVPYIVVKKWPKKTGYAKSTAASSIESPSTKPYPRVIPICDARFDEIPLVYAQLGTLIPSLTHVIEVYLVATKLLSCTDLGSLGISKLSLVATAISAPCARGDTNYERLEFIGDSLLKLCATVNCTSKYLNFPEGYLSLVKDRLIANSRLARAAIEFSLDQFIITRQFTLREWRNLYDTDLTQVEDLPSKTRQLSTKTQADVVEALIGASYVDGGISKALRCISLFLREIEWQPLEMGRYILYHAAHPTVQLPPTMIALEELIGYSFSKKSLLIEAMTHTSYNAPGTLGCLDRLEFLGDAILDTIVVQKLWHHDPPLEEHEMHLIRTALVNGDFLGFLVMDWHATEEIFEVTDQQQIVRSEFQLPLWKFLRYSSGELALEADAADQRHKDLRGQIHETLQHGTHYPWALLARLRAQKFFSDIFESLLGAVWIDSGDMALCERILEKAGILSYMKRILKDNVEIKHPKEKLGQLADREKVQYVVETIQHDEGEKEFVCKILVGKRCIVEMGGGISKEEVKIKAAEQAVRMWKLG